MNGQSETPQPNQTRSALTELPAWKDLETEANKAKQRSLQDYFNTDPNRAENYRFDAAGLTFDLAKHHIDGKILALLLKLADSCAIENKIQGLLNGEIVNITEQRAALHSKLRGNPIQATDTTIDDQIEQTQLQMQRIVNRITNGQWLGYSGQAITDVVNIGIGGSDLGPQMAVRALQSTCPSTVNSHFVANIDPSDLANKLNGLNPATTLFIVVSKSMSTLETKVNAEAARQWLLESAPENTDIAPHFIAVSTNIERCAEFGIAADHVLPMWDWVGGRYSLWSAAGLSIAIAIGFDNFSKLLTGAAQMDQHFANSPADHNIPLLLALLEVWYVNFWGVKSWAILPYAHDLGLLPNHLQQMIMESNGKQVQINGEPVNYSTCPVIWGTEGTNGQHSFHQLLHQGTELIPVDFILPAHSEIDEEQHRWLVANCFAQAEVLMDGQSTELIEAQLMDQGMDAKQAKELAKHKAISGNKPSTMILMDRLTPATLGALIAFYEHKTFCSSVIWNINAFDQWGVELGKTIAEDIMEQIANDSTADTNNSSDTNNPSTTALVNWYKNNSK